MNNSSTSLVKIDLFGATTLTGAMFREQLQSAPWQWSLSGYSRDPSVHGKWLKHVDLLDPAPFYFAGHQHSSAQFRVLVSFAPIWLLAPFLDHLSCCHLERLQGIHGVIACSSSSALTKRFAANRFDRQLVRRLVAAEQQLLATCSQLQVPCRILRPTLIYGQVGPYRDQNLSRLIALLRRLPLFPLPAETGLRQPIHASQLAAVALQMANQLVNNDWDPGQPNCIEVGGDTELSYTAMLLAIQHSLPQDDSARQCRLIPVPNRLFFLLAAPLLIRSPKTFEAVLRMGADLSGFTPAHQHLGEPPQPFPVQPLAR